MFRIWSCLIRLAWLPVLAIMLLLCVPYVRNHASDLVAIVAIVGILTAGLLGGWFGILMMFDRLRWRCPCCDRKSPVYGSRRDGMWMECECGTIRCRGFFGVTVHREPREETKLAKTLD
jgi:hypothetical protein